MGTATGRVVPGIKFLFILCVLHASEITAGYIAPPRIILTSFLVNTTEKKYGDEHILAPDENNIQISYEAIDLNFSGAMLYRYRLHAGSEWLETQNTKLTFPSMAAGNYRFEVSARTDKSDWSSPSVLSFTIRRHFYQATWFIIYVGIFLCAATFFALRWRNRAVLKKQKEFFSAQIKINDMENQAKRAMMNPHFVFNALNSIQQYIQENDKVSANKYLTKFSRLIRLNLDLSNKKYITLEEELEKLKLYLEIEKLRFGNKLNYDFTIDSELETDVVYIPSMVLQPFVENSIWHGILPAETYGFISVKAEPFDNDAMLRICIEDNGIGIHASQHLKQKNAHMSMGTQLTIDRIDLFCKKFKRAGQVYLKDLSESNPSIHGTSVCIEIPLVYPAELSGAG